MSEVGRARRAHSTAKSDARGARPLQAGWTRAARAQCATNFIVIPVNGVAEVSSATYQCDNGFVSRLVGWLFVCL